MVLNWSLPSYFRSFESFNWLGFESTKRFPLSWCFNRDTPRPVPPQLRNSIWILFSIVGSYFPNSPSHNLSPHPPLPITHHSIRQINPTVRCRCFSEKPQKKIQFRCCGWGRKIVLHFYNPHFLNSGDIFIISVAGSKHCTPLRHPRSRIHLRRYFCESRRWRITHSHCIKMIQSFTKNNKSCSVHAKIGIETYKLPAENSGRRKIYYWRERDFIIAISFAL